MTELKIHEECIEAVATATVMKIKNSVKGKVVYWHNILGDTLTLEVYRQGTLMYSRRYHNITDRIMKYENSDSLSTDFIKAYRKEVMKHFFK